MIESHDTKDWASNPEYYHHKTDDYGADKTIPLTDAAMCTQHRSGDFWKIRRLDIKPPIFLTIDIDVKGARQSDPRISTYVNGMKISRLIMKKELNEDGSETGTGREHPVKEEIFQLSAREEGATEKLRKFLSENPDIEKKLKENKDAMKELLYEPKKDVADHDRNYSNYLAAIVESVVGK